jgi:uncharacterized delta-60 repeat protein
MRSALRPRLEPLEDRCLLSGGVLDPTFGTGGLVTTAIASIDYRSIAVATYPPEGTVNDRLIVAAGNTSVTTGLNVTDYLAVLRYTLKNGNLDTTFGGTGEVTTVKGTTTAVAVQPDGKVVVAGKEPSEVVRLNFDGTLDKSFGKGGVASMAISHSLDPTAGRLVLQPDGKIVVAGINGGGLAVERFTSNGTLDASFGSGGVVTTSFTTPLSSWYPEPALDPNNGQIVVVAETAPPVGPHGTVVVRYTTTGGLDTGFFNNPQGYVTLGKPFIPSVAVQSDDCVVVAGAINVPGGTNRDIGLERLTALGAPDSSFGTNGAVDTSTSSNDVVGSVAIQANGKVLVSGTQNSTFLVARYNTDGSLDTAFGTNGIATTESGVGPRVDMALEPDGRIVLASYTNAPGQVVLALARFLATGPQINSFTDPMIVGSSVTLTASVAALNPGSTVTQVAFYYFDSNGNKVTLGTVTGTQTSPGVWSFTLTVNLAPGTYTLFAQAEDSYGAFSDPRALPLAVQ